MPLVLEDPDELLIVGASADQATLDASGIQLQPGEVAVRIPKVYMAPFRHADQTQLQAQQDAFRARQPYAPRGPLTRAPTPGEQITGTQPPSAPSPWRRGHWRRHRV